MHVGRITDLSEETLRCPNCGTGVLSTPLIRIIAGDGKRKSKSLPMKWCRFCNIMIPISKDVKFWNGKEAVEVLS